jgi:hypothetical protein
MALKRLNLEVDERFHRHLKAVAAARGCSVKELVTQALFDSPLIGVEGGWVGLDDEPTLAERAKAVAKARAAESKGK